MKKFLKFSLITIVAILAIGSINSCKKTFDSPPGPVDPNLVATTSVAALKAMHTSSGAFNVITTDIIISGTVVADDKSGNFYKQLFIEDATGGLQILLDATNLYTAYPVGRKIWIKCNGLCISDYNGTMELGVKATVAGAPSLEAIPATLISNYVVGGSLNNPVTPHVVTLAQLTTGMQDRYLGTLIQLDGFAFNDLNATYADTSAYKNTVNLDIKNCSGNTVIVRSSGYSNFAGQRVAQGRGSIRAIYTTYGTTKQLIIRDPSDVAFTDPYACPLPPGTVFFQDFNAIGANNLALTLPGWKNVGEVGGVQYQNAVFGSTKCGKISAFSTGANPVTSWMITPPINLTGTTAPKLTFLEAAGYAFGSCPFTIMVSTNYAGSNTPSTSTWTTLMTINASTPTTGYATLTSVGNINLSAYIGQTVYIAFKYDGGDPTKTTTYEFDDVKVTAN